MRKVGTIYTGKTEVCPIIFNRVWAMPNAWTFSIRPIRELLDRYVTANGANWIDPFAGKFSPAGMTNDINPEMPTQYHMEALDFAKSADHEVELI